VDGLEHVGEHIGHYEGFQPGEGRILHPMIVLQQAADENHDGSRSHGVRIPEFFHDTPEFSAVPRLQVGSQGGIHRGEAHHPGQADTYRSKDSRREGRGYSPQVLNEPYGKAQRVICRLGPHHARKRQPDQHTGQEPGKEKLSRATRHGVFGYLGGTKLPIPTLMSSPAVVVRRADASDIDSLTRLFDGYRVFYRKPSDPDGARRFLAERLDNDDSVIFLAIWQGKAVGFTQLYPLFSSVRMRPIWLLNDLFVATEARKQGVGKALMLRAQAFAAETGAAGLELATATDNHAAKSVYEALGWVRDTDFDHYSITL
jgi:GNAT superfamily N-acetyltransferase